MNDKSIVNLLNKIDEDIYCCNKCNNLVEKFPKVSTVYLGKNNDIVLI